MRARARTHKRQHSYTPRALSPTCPSILRHGGCVLKRKDHVHRRVFTLVDLAQRRLEHRHYQQCTHCPPIHCDAQALGGGGSVKWYMQRDKLGWHFPCLRRKQLLCPGSPVPSPHTYGAQIFHPVQGHFGWWRVVSGWLFRREWEGVFFTKHATSTEDTRSTYPLKTLARPHTHNATDAPAALHACKVLGPLCERYREMMKSCRVNTHDDRCLQGGVGGGARCQHWAKHESPFAPSAVEAVATKEAASSKSFSMLASMSSVFSPPPLAMATRERRTRV